MRTQAGGEKARRARASPKHHCNRSSNSLLAVWTGLMLMERARPVPLAGGWRKGSATFAS